MPLRGSELTVDPYNLHSLTNNNDYCLLTVDADLSQCRAPPFP